jgi:hypothetical protein
MPFHPYNLHATSCGVLDPGLAIIQEPSKPLAILEQALLQLLLRHILHGTPLFNRERRGRSGTLAKIHKTRFHADLNMLGFWSRGVQHALLPPT